MIADNVSPDDSIDRQPVLGLIGMGEMGKMYAKHLSNAGWKKYVYWMKMLWPSHN